MMSHDASDMLAAALEQMDGIIAGSKALEYSGMLECQSPTSPFMGSLRALQLLEDLHSVLELMESDDRDSLRGQIPDCTCQSLVSWLQGHMSNGHMSLSGDLYQERLSRLESDKESLVLQVSVLTDQVEAQGEKIRDLDVCLDEHREKLNATEDLLQQELLCRTALETQKLELISEVSNLKLKLNSIEKNRLDLDDRFSDSEDLIVEIHELRFRVTDLESEKLQFEKKFKSTKEELVGLRRQLQGKEVEMRMLQEESGPQSMGERVFPPDETLKKRLKEKHVEVQRMKKAVESLMAANEEKDRKVEELKQSLQRYKKVQEMVMSVQGKKEKSMEAFVDASLGSFLSQGLCLEPEAEEAQPSTEEENRIHVESSPSPSPSDMEPESESTATDAHRAQDLNRCSQEQLDRINNQRNSSEEIRKPGGRLPLGPSSTLPSSTLPSSTLPSSTLPSSTLPASIQDDSFGSRKARSSFGKGFFKIRGGKKTNSTPNLAETERPPAAHLDLAGLPQTSSTSDSTHTLSTTKKPKGITKLFGKLKRSRSTTFDLSLSEGEFKRGGVRSTAGPRLGWSRDLQQSNSEVDAPFARWSKEQVCDWLQEQGLGLYGNMARVWISSGQTLLQASQHDLEKELGIKQPLHRKKLQLALQSLGSEEEDTQGRLDYHWVTRWLDDIGLPQYKTQFDEARVDGRMLHYMTVEDLLSLRVGSVLHHLSIKRAVQVLRLNNYQPNCLRRRPSDESAVSPAEVSQWTNHRVMEWLRSVDLAEYAPNLRGSGVHGGLMVLEPRFNVETMALLLNIPPNKTLLRRHLVTHFSQLIGPEAQTHKQDCVENPDYTLLTATSKVKPRKLSFGGFRKKKSEESEEYVCPMDVEMPKGRSFQKDFQVYEDDLDRLQQMDDSEGTVRQIGAFSEGIQNLTSMLKDEEFFEAALALNLTDEESNA